MIDKRLLEIANLVTKCNLLADIGTDHGYLPIYLVSNNIVNKAIASDISINSLNKAKENILKTNLNNKIETIVSDGLENISKDVDTIVISGMGGELISSILDKAKYKYNSYILQANSNVDKLRNYLSLNNYKIIDEKVVCENKKYYEIIKAIPNTKSLLNENEILFGPINLIKKEKDFLDFINYKLIKYSDILYNFKGNSIERNKLETYIYKLQNILKGKS